MREGWRRIGNVAQALRLKRRERDPGLSWAPGQPARFPEGRGRAGALRAAERSAFYRERYQGLDLERGPLSALPPVEKGELMERFDAAVTDPALRREEVEAYLRAGGAEAPFQERFEVLLTSGSTGQR